jgi:hypothetical protein
MGERMSLFHKKTKGSYIILATNKYRKPRLRKIPTRIRWSRNRFERIFFPSDHEVLRSNNDKFTGWVLKQLKKTGQTLEQGQNYNACALYLNEKNLQKLNKLIDPMVYLNYSPVTSNNLPNNILGISLKDVLQDIDR